MTQDALLSAFTALVQKTEEPLLFHFKEIPEKEAVSRPPITEILSAEYQGKIRYFELNFTHSRPILDAFQLPLTPSAVVFWKGKTRFEWQGYRNARNFLRKVLFLKKEA